MIREKKDLGIIIWFFDFEAYDLEKNIFANQQTCLCRYVLQLDIIRSDFKSGLEALLNAKPIRAIFLGVRIGDPTAVFVMLYSKNNTMMTLR